MGNHSRKENAVSEIANADPNQHGNPDFQNKMCVGFFSTPWSF